MSTTARSTRTQLFIGGRFVDSAQGATFATLDPATNAPIAEVAEARAEDVDRAVAAARRAFASPQWRDSSAHDRAALLRRLATALRENADELASLESRDAGKPYRETAQRDVPRAAENCEFFADAIEARPAESFEAKRPFLGSERHIHSMVRHEPLGVCALLTPWNSPLMQATWKIAPAIATGNTCILKPSELTPLSTLKLAELCAAAGFPDGVINVVPGFGVGAGAALAAHPDVDGIAFTGSEPTGVAINIAAAPTLKKVTLELGGKSANIVLADADLDLAVAGSMLAMFRHSGQVCLAGTRLFIERSIYDAFLERFLERVRALRVGDPQDPATDMGPLISPAHRARVEAFIERAHAERTRCIISGARPSDPALQAGNYLEPTIFAPERDDAAVATDEIFGPVLSIFAFDTLEEAITRANASRYGLAGYLWTRDTGRALEAAQRLEVGMCWINGYFLRDLRQPFGGIKRSGLGREGGRWSLDFFTNPKLICVAD